MSTPSSRKRSLSAQNQTQSHLLACSSSSSPPPHKRGRSISISNSNSISSSAVSINSLRDELLTEILIRLPNFPKSAIQCKCVCKRWLALIGDPYFTRRLMQRRQAVQQPVALISQYRCSIEIPNADGVDRKLRTTFWDSEEQVEMVWSNHGFISPSLSFLPCYRGAELEEEDPIWVVSSFNDLLLCCPREHDHSAYYVCNPITKQWVQLPPRPSQHQHYREEIDPYSHVGFICEPDKNRFTVVVVYQEKCKLVYDQEKRRCRRAYYDDPSFVYDDQQNTRFDFDIFSSETGQWRHTMAILPKTVHRPIGSLVACNGMLHWMNSRCNVIALSLDPQGNNNNMCHYHCIDPPDDIVNKKVDGIGGFLGVCQGRLRICWQGFTGYMVWELKDYKYNIEDDDNNNNNGHSGGTQWSLVHKVDLIEFHSDDPNVAEFLKDIARGNVFSLKMAAFHPTDGDVVYLSHSICMLLCNMRTRTLRIAETEALEFDDSMIMSANETGAFSLVLPLWPTRLPVLPHHGLS